MIQIYKPNNTNYEKNGDITLFPSSAKISVKLNDIWQATLSHPIDNEERWKYIEDNAVVKMPSFNGEQLFRIKHKQKSESNIIATLEPIFMDAMDDCYLVDVRPTDKNGQQALNMMLVNSKYQGESDIKKVSTAYYQDKNLIEAINSDDENSFINRWGGEMLFDNFKIIINEQVGTDKGVEVLYGKNIAVDGISEEVDIRDVKTRIYPKAYNGYRLSGTGYVDSPKINNYPTIKTANITFENIKMRADASEDDEENGIIICDTQAQLDKALKDKCNKEFENGLDKPKVTIDIDMVLLQNTEQYKEYKDLENVSIGDTIKCVHSKLGIGTKARVIELEYDSILNVVKRVTLGDFKNEYFDKVSSTINKIDSVVRDDGTVIAEQVKGFINGAWAQLKLQNTVAKKQDVRAILFEDTDPKSPTFGAMGLGTQGLQISRQRTPDDRNWIWTTALTAKGMIADIIVAGLLIDRTGRSFWDLNNGKLQLSGIFRQYAENGYKSVEIGNNAIQFYAWHKNGDEAGSIGTLKGNGENAGRTYMGMWTDYGDILLLGVDNPNDPNKITPVIEFDSTKPNATPYIINTANGKLLGGIEVENGLIKDWNLNATSGTAFNNLTSGGIKVKDGLIVDWDLSSTWDGTVTINGIRMTFNDGLLTNVKEVKTAQNALKEGKYDGSDKKTSIPKI